METGKFVKLNNSGGSVHLQIPKGKGLNLDIHGDRIKTEGLSNFSGSMEKQSISGTVNGGGTPVDIDAGSGGVTIGIKVNWLSSETLMLNGIEINDDSK